MWNYISKFIDIPISYPQCWSINIETSNDIRYLKHLKHKVPVFMQRLLIYFNNYYKVIISLNLENLEFVISKTLKNKTDSENMYFYSIYFTFKFYSCA